jgi:hypothetical protein
VTAAYAETFKVRVVRDVSYLQGANYADDKDKLDLYLPEGRDKAPVIVSYYGNQLMGGDKAEDAFVGQRFASAGFVTVVVNYRLAWCFASGARAGRGRFFCVGQASHRRVRGRSRSRVSHRLFRWWISGRATVDRRALSRGAQAVAARYPRSRSSQCVLLGRAAWSRARS